MDISQHPWKCTWTTASFLLQRRPNKSSSKAKSLSNAVQHTAFHRTHKRLLFLAMQNSHKAWKVCHLSPGKQFLQGKEKFTLPDIENMPFFPGNQFLQGKKKSTLGTKLKPFVDTCTFTLGTDQHPFVDTDQKPSTSSKDTHKKGRMTATIGMTAMIGITLKTVNMITTCILMSVPPQV